jgi:cytochrome c biogenesis protein CcdA
MDFADGFGIDSNDRGIPFLVIEQEGKYSYLLGDGPIIEHLNDSIADFRGVDFNVNVDYPFLSRLTLGVVIVAALIDSINPCAFGVLLFLMAALLSMGSSRRALRAGILYTFVIFVVYLVAGLGIMKIINSSSFLVSNVKLFVGVIVLIGALIEFKDFFWEGKGFSLKIPTSAKPMLEKYVRKGTLPAIFVLGALVALVELPCTGGIYLAILSLISSEGTRGLMYLVLYNLIFVLPLILITYIIYKGTKIDSINIWVQKNKRFMRLAAGIIMVLLGLSLLGVL